MAQHRSSNNQRHKIKACFKELWKQNYVCCMQGINQNNLHCETSFESSAFIRNHDYLNSHPKTMQVLCKGEKHAALSLPQIQTSHFYSFPRGWNACEHTQPPIPGPCSRSHKSKVRVPRREGTCWEGRNRGERRRVSLAEP